MIEKIIKTATEEREVLLHKIAKLGAQVGELKQERARLLYENGLNTNTLEMQQLNEKLHNARRVLAAWNKRRECLDFMLAYLSREGATTNE